MFHPPPSAQKDADAVAAVIHPQLGDLRRSPGRLRQPGLPLLPEDRHHAVRREPARPLILLSLPALWTVTRSFTGVGGWLGKAAQDHGEPHSLRRRSGVGGPSSLELSIDP